MIFVTRSGKPMDRSNIWREMKQISRKAGINPDKVFPHNLRHLFARVYYSQEKDLVRLADILGHSSVNTTRIYTMESGENHLRQLEKDVYKRQYVIWLHRELRIWRQLPRRVPG